MEKWMKEFPLEDFQAGKIEENLVYDYARSGVATAYAQEKNTKKLLP